MTRTELNRLMETAIGNAEALHCPGFSEYLTPRCVERLAPGLNRGELSRRRALQLPPRHDVIGGCIMYAQDVVEDFLFDNPHYICSSKRGPTLRKRSLPYGASKAFAQIHYGTA